MSDQATLQAYGGQQVEVTIARGVTVRGPCLTLKQAFRIIELDREVAAQKDGAFRKMIEEFVEATGIGDERITFTEIYDEVIPGFLAGTGLGNPTPSAPGDSTT